MPIDVTGFINNLQHGGARPTLFKVRFAPPRGVSFSGSALKGFSKSEFMVKAAQLPGRTDGVIELSYQGRKIKLPGDPTFPEWQVTVINDEDFAVKNAMEMWQSAINEHVENVRKVNDVTQLMSDITVDQISQQGKVIKSYVLKYAFPSDVAPIEVSWEQNDTVEEFTVSWNYSWWESNTTDGKGSGSMGNQFGNLFK